MQRYTKFKQMRPRRSWRGAGSWVGVVIGLAAVGWVLWRHGALDGGAKEPVRASEARAVNGAEPGGLAPPVARRERAREGSTPVAGTLSGFASNASADLLAVPVPGESPVLFPSAPYPKTFSDALSCQVALVRRGLSPGSIDGKLGPQTRTALRAFQESEGLHPAGLLDQPTRERLGIGSPPLRSFAVGSNHVAQLHPLPQTWVGKSLEPQLGYETLLELVAEQSQSNPKLLLRLNPGFCWDRATPGMRLWVPDASLPRAAKKVARVMIRLSERILQGVDDAGKLLCHFPCSIAAETQKRPLGVLHVVSLAPNPVYRFSPENYPESAEARELQHALMLPAGPNSPVGTVWIGLDREGYGIHGTPHPEEVGRTESRGCFRLANWNAEYLLGAVEVGTLVLVEP